MGAGWMVVFLSYPDPIFWLQEEDSVAVLGGASGVVYYPLFLGCLEDVANRLQGLPRKASQKDGLAKRSAKRPVAELRSSSEDEDVLSIQQLVN